MTAYSAPLREMQFVINELAGLESLARLPGYEELNSELAGAVLEDSGKNRRRGARTAQQAR